jgi:hypothetical protein
LLKLTFDLHRIPSLRRRYPAPLCNGGGQAKDSQAQV